MSTFTFKKITKRAADLNGESSLPAVNNVPLKKLKPAIGYDDTKGLFMGYGYVFGAFPHRELDQYTRPLKDREMDAVILENEYLRAEFIPSVGGKLWSLYDKVAKRDLLFNNPVLRYGNLSTRNAWTSGGVEFNIGERGHHAYTCDTLFTAKTELDDGTPVLRFYEFDRIRSAVYQIDFWLPDDSRVLFCRMRITNPNLEVIPMYWWSNAAIPSWEKGRVLVPAEEAYSYDYASGIVVVPIPYHHDADMSYSDNNPCSDTFYDIPDGRRRFICYSDKDGYTYAHTSTNRLISRKMFVWGPGNGGKRWQEFLSGDGNPGSYIELQAGIAHTQEEHIPMPPLTSWEWIETYGSVSIDPAVAHGDYRVAVSEAEKKLDAVISAAKLEELLQATKAMATSPAKEILIRGTGWGALENLRRASLEEPSLPTHLDFTTTEAPQAQWEKLLKDGSFGKHDPLAIPESWMRQNEWTEMMETAIENKDANNWYTHLQLGCTYLSTRNFRFAREALEKSLVLAKNPWALYGLSCLERTYGNKEQAAQLALEAALMKPDDVSLNVAAVVRLNEAEQDKQIIEHITSLGEEIRSNSRLRMYLTYALLRSGKIKEADEELNRDGGIDVTDIREGEISITNLWYDIEESKAKAKGQKFDRKKNIPPKKFDFRMTV